MSFSDEEIIAFLLGDADDGLASKIRSSLTIDEDLAERVTHFRSVLSHLDGMVQHFEPPVDLVENTMSRIEATCVERVGEFDRPIASCLTVAVETPSTTRGWVDSIALTLSLTALCCLTIPAIVRARFESRKAQCAENLRQTGMSLFEYASRRSDRRFPFVPSSGPEAFSGVFVIKLNDQGLLPAGRMMPCASLNGVERPSLVASRIVVPTLEDLRSADESERESLMCTVGGDYAYNLGVFDEGVLVAPKNTGSSHLAILADAPVFVEDKDQIVSHDGKGINILYDDGQVRFVNSHWIQSGETADNPFRNLLGVHEAGLSPLDASLAPSQFPPLTRKTSY